jgi:hypothetical protein
VNFNNLDMEWDDDGCVAKASGFAGIMLTCPRCQEVLPRDVEHRCGDKVTETIPSQLRTGTPRIDSIKYTMKRVKPAKKVRKQ